MGRPGPPRGGVQAPPSRARALLQPAEKQDLSFGKWNRGGVEDRGPPQQQQRRPGTPSEGQGERQGADLAQFLGTQWGLAGPLVLRLKEL